MRIDRVKLIAEMARRDLQVKELAAKAGVSRMTVTAVRGGKTCSASTATKLADALGIGITEIIKQEGEQQA